MERWIGHALLAMLFAGCTSVIAKQGLTGITGEVGLAVRTIYVFLFVLLFAAFQIPWTSFAPLTGNNLFWLGLSGVTTAASWIFYYKALKAGDVATVALIDKGSFLIAVLLAWLLLGERITPRIVIGSLLILAGLLVVARK